jgi:ATP-binding cassette subfamily B protein
MRLLLAHLKPYKAAVAMTLALATVNQFLLLVEPQLLRLMVDRYVMRAAVLTPEQFFRGVAGLVAAAVIVAMVARVLKSVQEFSIQAVAQRVGAALYSDALAHALLLPFRILEDQRSGELLERMERARTDARGAVTQIVQLYLSALALTVVTLYAFHVHWALGALHLVIVPLLAVITLAITAPIKRQQRVLSAEESSLAGAATETMRNIELVKSLGLEQQEIGRLREVNDRIIGLEKRKLRLIRLFNFGEGTAVNVARAGLLLAMLWLVYQRAITTGEFLTLFLYSQSVFNPLIDLGLIVARQQEIRSTMDTVGEMLDLPGEARATGTARVGPLAHISFEGVSLRHDRITALEGIDLQLRAGETVAFVGPSGAGKSSIVKLVFGLYLPSEGRLRWNGTDIRQLDLVELRQRVGVVTHDTNLFAGTVRDNLRFVRPEATDNECLEALVCAAALPIIEAGGAGLDTRIGEGGMKLSGGERQRIAIARALLRKPELIVFDEATSNLDSLTERAITSTIRDVGRTARMTIIVAHRLSTVVHADRIVVLERGRITESGSHASLVASGGLYAAMWREQSAGVGVGAGFGRSTAG